MNIHEYQAKNIFRKYGIPVANGCLVKTPEEALECARQAAIPGLSFVVKSQIHAGARGKGGGIKIVKTKEEVMSAARKLLGSQLVTPQTGPEGKPVNVLLVESTTKIASEFYASIVLDRSEACPCLIVSEAGGMNIEEVAARTPEKVIKYHFPIEEGLAPEKAREAALKLVENASHAAIFADIFVAMAKLYVELDVSLVEINPLAIMTDNEVLAIDAKINFDDNALYRHTDIAVLRDARQEDPREAEAKKFDLSYVGLDGNIGCIVNGAGLAMATMDIIKVSGGEPANFLDVGGGANKEKVAAAFKIILRDPKVKAILVNIFGGIMRCDIVAEGIIAAIRELEASDGLDIKKLPLVVRLEGTNVKEGKALLEQSGLRITSAANFQDAAEKVVAAL